MFSNLIDDVSDFFLFQYDYFEKTYIFDILE